MSVFAPFCVQAVETLLKGNADPSLSLTHGVGSPLCAAVSFTAEKRRKIVDHIRLVGILITTVRVCLVKYIDSMVIIIL